MRLLFLLFMIPTVASAGFDRWTSESQDDPFTGGRRIAIDYLTSIRSGVFIYCDTSEKGFVLRSVPGFAHVPGLELIEPVIEIAVDGSVIASAVGGTGAVGDNLAAADARFDEVKGALTFVDAFSKAKKQIAINDGISDRPALLTARGSTKAGELLRACLEDQS